MKRPLRLFIVFLAAALAPAVLYGAANAQPPIPAGTRVDVQLTTTLSTSANQKGDPFIAKVEDPIFAQGQEVIPAGSTLRGHVAFVKPPGRVKGKAEMRLVADSIVTRDGKQYSFSGQLANHGDEGTVQGAGKGKKRAAEESGIGAAAGAGVGAIAAGGDGALYGAGIGALAGAIHMIAKRHENIVLHPGTELTFVFTTSSTASKATKSSAISAPFVCATCQ